MSDLTERQSANTKIKKHRKKPVVIEAYQTDVEMDIETLEGVMHANIGDYIITGVNGEQYPCKPDIFKKTYDEIYDEIYDEDSISRQSVLNILLYFNTTQQLEMIKNLPSAQPEQRWIPCSERLPEKEGIYLCTVGADYRNPREMIYAPDNTFRAEDSDTWMSIDGYRVYDWFVIAWMPLPKPYKMDEVEE